MRTRQSPTSAAIAAVLLLLTACSPGASQPVPAEPDTTASAPTASAPTAPATVTIASLKGPTTMGLVKLMQDVEEGAAALDYRPTMYGSPDEVVPLIVQGKVDVALLPANLAAVLYNKTKGSDAEVTVAAVTTLGVLEVVEAGNTINSVADLKGHTIYSTGRGASPEYVLNYVLTRNGLSPGDDVTVEYLSEATEVAARVASEPGAVGVLPQPFVTVLLAKSPQTRSALRLTDEWATVTDGSPLVTGVLVVRRAFAEQHPDALSTFLDDFRSSTRFTNDNPAAAAPLIVAAGIAPSDAVAVAAIPLCNIVDLEGEPMREALGAYLDVLFAADPASVGGSIPGDDFYFSG
jgi:NitT/TauT family transport system substrate-binding protein